MHFRGEFIDLTPQEFSLLYVLTQASGAPLSRTDLLRRAWPDAIDNPRTVDTHILSLRKKIEADPRQPNIIQTVRNVGYRFNIERLTAETNGHSAQPGPGLALDLSPELVSAGRNQATLAEGARYQGSGWQVSGIVGQLTP